MRPTRKVVPQAHSDGLRGAERSKSGDPIERVTVTLPASIIRKLDTIVYQRKLHKRAYNRSALIQELIHAHLEENVAATKGRQRGALR